MTGKNVAVRIVKLEARRHRPNEVLLVSRCPNGDVRAAASEATFAPGDRVICLEWFGAGPSPPPRWYRERLSSELGAVESEYLTRSLNRVVEGGPRDPAFLDVPPSRSCACRN